MNRLIFAFNPDLRFLEAIAKPCAPINILLSYHYLQNKKDDVIKQWGEWVHENDKLLYIDSGVFSIRKKYGVMDYGKWKLLSPEMKDLVRLNEQQQDEVLRFTDNYIDYLYRNYDYFDWAFEMDCDEFTSIEFADYLYQKTTDIISPDKIIRVWHSSRDFHHWKKWCKDDSIKYLAVEGGTVHSREPDFYNRFFDYAHRYDKKVHVLAITTKEFLRDTTVDSVDSSTWVNGGRFGSMIIPGIGHVIFSNQTDLTKDTSAVRMHYSLLDDYGMQQSLDWFAENGFTLNDVLKEKSEGSFIRCRINIEYFKKYIDTIEPLPAQKNRLF